MLLSFDTASPTVSVALLEGAEVVAEQVSDVAMRHGEQLAPLIESVLRAAGATRTDITAVGVGAGPGPFTGLRVGLVTARTLGLVLDVPVYAVCSLDALALEAVESVEYVELGAVPGAFLVATDARRKEVFWATYGSDGERLTGPSVDRPAEVGSDLPAVGEGAWLYPDSFPDRFGPRRPSAGWLGLAIVEERAELLDPDPLYLRRPDAEVPRAPKPVS